MSGDVEELGATGAAAGDALTGEGVPLATLVSAMGELSAGEFQMGQEFSVSTGRIRFILENSQRAEHQRNVATKFLQTVNRGKKIEVLPDMRLRVTVRLDAVDIQATAGDSDKFDANVRLPWGDPDPDFPQCRLIRQDDMGQTDNPNKSPNDPPAYIVRVYEEIDENSRTQVGRTEIDFDQYGRKTVVDEFLQFSDGTTTYTDVVGTTPAPAPNAECILKTFESTNDGTLIRTKLTYIDSGEMARDYTLSFAGNLIILTITSLNEIPATPAGYTLFGPGVEFVDGLPLYRYRFTAVNGGGVPGTNAEIDRNVEYFYSPDQGATGITRTTIKMITAQSVMSNPITGPVGSELVSVEYADQDGYKLWTASYSQGTGTISSEVETHEAGSLIIYKLTSLNAPPATPSPTIGGTVVLIDADVQNGTRIEDGNVVYRYTFAEGEGQVDLGVQGTGDGSLIYQVTDLNAAIATPAYPGSGTAYLINLKNEARDGYYLNVATYHKPPATVTLKQTTQFEKPGVAIFTGSPPQLVLTPPVTLTLLADMEVSYDTSQITDAPFTVEAPASFFEAYTPTATGIPVTNTVSLGRYLAGASSISGSASFYNGVLCDTWAATLVSSTPSTFPTGATVLHTDNEIYLVDLSGTVVYRRRKISYSF